MVCARKDDAKRRINREQREIQFERDHVEDPNAVPYANANLWNACEDVMSRNL